MIDTKTIRFFGTFTISFGKLTKECLPLTALAFYSPTTVPAPPPFYFNAILFFIRGLQREKFELYAVQMFNFVNKLRLIAHYNP